MPIHLYVAYGCFHNTAAELSSCERGHMAVKLFNYLTFTEKKCMLTCGTSSTISLYKWRNWSSNWRNIIKLDE